MFECLNHKRNEVLLYLFFFEEMLENLSVFGRGYFMIQSIFIVHKLFAKPYSW